MVFVCKQGGHEEDLTARVLAKASSRPLSVYRLNKGSLLRRRQSLPSATKTVVVYCSKGHRNQFKLERKKS